MNFITAMSQALRTHQNKQKRKAGTRAYYSSGHVTLSRIFAYKLVGDRYEPDERYAPAIRTIFKMLSEGATIIEVKRVLDSMKARDSSNNKYGLARIISISERPIYSGYLLNRGRLAKIENVTEIVSLDLWKKAQRQLRIEKKKVIK